MQLDNKLCIGCGLCKKDCPAGAIEMVDFYGKNRPQFRLDKCLFCFQCAESCPKKAIKTSDIYELAAIEKASLVMKPNTLLYAKHKIIRKPLLKRGSFFCNIRQVATNSDKVCIWLFSPYARHSSQNLDSTSQTKNAVLFFPGKTRNGNILRLRERI